MNHFTNLSFTELYIEFQLIVWQPEPQLKKNHTSASSSCCQGKAPKPTKQRKDTYRQADDENGRALLF